MDLHRFWDDVIISSSNLTRIRNDATSLRNRQEFQRSQLTEVANTNIEAWVKESYEIAPKIYNEVRPCLVSLVLKKQRRLSSAFY